MKRIQRKRTKGWRMPENAISITRPGKYGNPFKIGKEVDDKWMEFFDRIDFHSFFVKGYVPDREDSIYLFEKYVLPTLDLSKIKDKDIACFCRLDQECHGDTIIRKINISNL